MENQGPDEVVSVDSEDEQMLSAINEARQSLRKFLNAFFSPKPNQRNFLLKVAFDADGQREHIWLADLDLDASPPTGVVANEPQISTLTYMDRVPFDLALVTDWMYYEDDCLVGAFTTRILLSSARRSYRRFTSRGQRLASLIVGALGVLVTLSLQSSAVVSLGYRGLILSSTVAFPGLVGSMVIAGDVHAFSLWIAAILNGIFYCGLCWMICALFNAFWRKIKSARE